MQLDDTLIALADDTRRSILRRLASGEARVTEVAEPFDKLTQWMQDTRQFWSSRLDLLEAALRADDAIEKAKKTPPPPKKRSRK